MEIDPDFKSQCQRVLSEKGRLSTALPGFRSRPAQSDLAAAIAEAIEEKGILVAEAGTGTGKTYAYLVPCLLSGGKALISTATTAGSALPERSADAGPGSRSLCPGTESQRPRQLHMPLPGRTPCQ